MASPVYLDFDLQITPATDGYLARVLNSPAGQAAATFRPPFTAGELNAQIQPLLQTVAQDELKRLGSQFFAALFHDELQTCFRRSVDAARRQNAGLRLKLRLTDTPELANLPWEYLYDPTANRFLTLAAATPLVHYLELPEPPRPLAVTPPLRILAVIASPTDLPALDVEREWTQLQTALSDLVRNGQVLIDRLQPPTLPALQSALRRQAYHIFHFVGHATFDPTRQEGVLALVDTNGLASLLGARQLGQLIHNEPSLALAVLNACEGARPGIVDPFAGLAQMLVQQGTPAVVAMQFQISDRAAILFSSEFYAALADGYGVDAAVTEARVAMATRLDTAEWGAPKLFMRATDGCLWQVETTTAGLLQVTGQPLDQALRALSDLLQTPAVRARIVAFRTDFQAAGEQIDVLVNYKELHDLLHNLEFLCYNGIVQEARRFPADTTAFGILTDHELTLQDIVRRLQSIAARPSLPTDETGWIGEIVEAQTRLQEALEKSDAHPLSRTLWLLRRVLYRHPARINERLNAAARALRLAAIVGAMQAIVETLHQSTPDSPKPSPTTVQQFATGVAALTVLNGGLTTLLNQHDRWQAIDLELRRIESSLSQDVSELEISWPGLQTQIEPLTQVGAAIWVDALNSDRNGLDGALQTQNPVRTRLYFQRFRRQVGHRFYQVDSELRLLCDELRRVGAPLAAVLQEVEQ
ncbi:MAG: CHAT domain-containing protein [Chloroflexota bacterium]|nr:CHAT domain-containing protein [Chloroflexota bacterium]